MRSIEFDPNGGDGDAATGWGLAVSGHLNLGARDKIYGAFAAAAPGPTRFSFTMLFPK